MHQSGRTVSHQHSFEILQGILRVSFRSGSLIDIDLLKEVLAEEMRHLVQLGGNDLWDLQDCQIARDVDCQSLREVVLSIKARGFRRDVCGKTAVLVNSDYVYGVVRTFQSIADIKGIGYEIELFQEESLALDWLHTPISQARFSLGRPLCLAVQSIY